MLPYSMVRSSLRGINLCSGIIDERTVDGGHRAIKYTRLDGVKPDIYNEGTHLAVRPSLLSWVWTE